MKKMKLMALPLSLLLMLGACSDEDKAEETSEPAESEAVPETVIDEPATDLDLPAADDVVVIVNGEEIKGTVYNSVARQLESSVATQGKKADDPEVAEQVKEQAISVIVGNKLVIQDAIEKGHEVDEEVLEQRFEDLKNQFENEEQMNVALKRTGFTLDDMKQQLREQLIYESYLADEIEGAEVTEEDLKEAYQGYVDSTEGETPEFEEMKPIILQSLEDQNEKQAVYDRIEELREAADVEVKI
ncbi:SurA N-terminal domain-containing protein [Planomicrobium okeanokoites]|uniref:SurA N-terminal domain-containing protein n=1 Tax=Planomicrobium okeanokoites TaxID=244 RepID=A0ABV7KII8_PLAOK|nr:SurA N-terminal domain-containing protein [Planomicrobium okeanokoites]TAA68979.1 peptidylprolyl isomerase [Planomicrobium okeanokoites]